MRFLVILLVSINLLAYEDFIKQAYYDSYTHEKRQDYGAAIRSLQVVYKRYPKAYTPNLCLGWLFYLNKNYANARSHYEAAVSIVPGSAEAKLGLILVLKAQERYDEAKRLIYDILQGDPYNYFANLYLADLLSVTAQYESSLYVIDKMLKYYPTDVAFLSWLAYVYVKQKKYDLAAGVYADIIILDPSHPDALSHLNQK